MDCVERPEPTRDDPLAALSVVIPVAPGDDAWQALLPDLAALPPAARIVLAAAAPIPHDAAGRIGAALPLHKWEWLETPRGRARQLNAGARAATGRHLWFLHADSRLCPDTIARLRTAIGRHPHALLFHDLEFLDDGPPLMRLNALGVRLRSRWLGMPFGDQGFCIARAHFDALGAFDESARYGEDHLFVWRARQAGVALRATGGTLRTSARRYREQGWGRTTARHVWLTIRQAVPEWRRLLRVRREVGRPA